MKGWVIDAYPDYEGNEMVLWVKTNRGLQKMVDSQYRPRFFVWAPEDQLYDIEEGLQMMGVRRTSHEERKTWLKDRKSHVLSVEVDEYGRLYPLARTVDGWGDYNRYRLFNVDLRFDQRYFLEHDIFPIGLTEFNGGYRSLDSPFRVDYPIPQLSSVDLEVEVDGAIPTMEDEIKKVKVGEEVLDGPEEAILNDISSLIKEKDPDIIFTTGGDDFFLPYLIHRAEENNVQNFTLGREEGGRISKGKSYFSYGRILYKPPAYKLRGRIHIDRRSSFMYSESGLYGLIDLSRLSRITLQDLCRLSPGSAISAMQVNEAVRSGSLVLWKKNVSEEFKTARELMMADRGGFIYEPEVGLHEQVVELDFRSLYPSIMVRFNISPETVMCDCCPRSSRRVPELGYRICERETGLIPRVIEPIIRRRSTCKRLMKDHADRETIYAQRYNILKWVLVTCFGYTGYKNARFGRIECHESINAFGREILLRASEMAERRGFSMLHGIIDSLWLQGGGDPGALCEEVEKEIGIPLEMEGRYKWVVFLPHSVHGMGTLNKYYGAFEGGGIKVRGVALRRSDTPPLVKKMQGEMLETLCRSRDRQQFRENIPAVLEIMEEKIEDLREGEIPLKELVIVKRVSKELDEYSQFNDSVAALRQLHVLGHRVPPGKVVRYVLRNSEGDNPWNRVILPSLAEEGQSYDAEKYVDLVLRATLELLSPFEWDMRSLQEHLIR